MAISIPLEDWIELKNCQSKGDDEMKCFQGTSECGCMSNPCKEYADLVFTMEYGVVPEVATDEPIDELDDILDFLFHLLGAENLFNDEGEDLCVYDKKVVCSHDCDDCLMGNLICARCDGLIEWPDEVCSYCGYAASSFLAGA